MNTGTKLTAIALLALSGCGGGGGGGGSDGGGGSPTDTTAPILAQVTPVNTPTNDTSPNYTFSSTEAGEITYGGDCSSATTSAAVGNNTVTFNALSEGNHSNCTVQVTDSAGNVSSVLTIPLFSIDSAPILVQVMAVPNGNDYTPNYIFSTTEAGTISYGGACSSATTTASVGNNTITLNALNVGFYQNCTIQVTDAEGNASAALNINAFTIGKPLNDTGITLCGDYAYNYSGYTGSGIHNNNVNCADGASPSSTTDQEGFEIANGLDSVPAGQDAVYGRDATPATNSSVDGYNGFSFTKLGDDGQPLTIQDRIYSDIGSEELGTKWSCVQDNVTGLVWEIKTNDGGLHDKDWTYTWYNSTGINTGSWGGNPDGFDQCSYITRCDTEKYVADVNAIGLCGASDWRMPRIDELNSIVDRGRFDPALDTRFFPITISPGAYWSSSPSASDYRYAWAVNFYYGYEISEAKDYRYGYVLLVRGGQ